MSTYEFAGVPLTPAVFAELSLRIAPREPFTRADLINLVVAHHETAGGLSARTSLAAVGKKALQIIFIAGHIRKVSHGYWQLTKAGTSPNVVASEDPATPLQLGDGPDSVYVYFFPAYRDQAAYRGREVWPMKIGRTAGELKPRIKDQVGTAMPEQPIVGLIYRTADGSNAERLLHSVLRSRDRGMPDAPGKEWFMTSVQEVREILEFAVSR